MQSILSEVKDINAAFSIQLDICDTVDELWSAILTTTKRMLKVVKPHETYSIVRAAEPQDEASEVIEESKESPKHES